jgi:hypothetical protein
VIGPAAPLSPATPAILLTLVEQPRHGYAILKVVEAQVGSPGLGTGLALEEWLWDAYETGGSGAGDAMAACGVLDGTGRAIVAVQFEAPGTIRWGCV